MTPQELAAKIDGADLKSGLDKFIDIAEDNALAIAYCNDQELFEIKGSMDSDYDVFRSETLCLFEFDDEFCLFDKLALGKKDDGDEYQYAAHEGAEAGNILTVTLNPEDGSNAMWAVATAFPSTSFDLMKGGKLFCRGVVFAHSEIK